jgi:beta-glucanase (GH16 family)
VIFEDNFDTFDLNKWQHAVTMAGGGNYEFQWVVNDRSNTYASNGILHIAPTLTSDKFGEEFVTSGTVEIPAWECTDASNWGCRKTGSPSNPIPPIRSGRINTYNSFGFKFGTVEIRAKSPTGDWIGAALWLLPIESIYGGWPASGEIDMMETKGNTNYWDPGRNNVQVGAERMGSTLNYGPRWDINGWSSTTASRNRSPGFNENFHIYKMVWTPESLQFFLDGERILSVTPGDGGFWERGGFGWTGLPNPWVNGTRMAPFDNEFGIILSHGVGGTSVFSDNYVNGNGQKPWVNNNGRAMADFWIGRSQWKSQWELHTARSHLQVDYVRVWAL